LSTNSRKTCALKPGFQPIATYIHRNGLEQRQARVFRGLPATGTSLRGRADNEPAAGGPDDARQRRKRRRVVGPERSREAGPGLERGGAEREERRAGVVSALTVITITRSGSYGHGKPGKVMEFKNIYFQAWKSH